MVYPSYNPVRVDGWVGNAYPAGTGPTDTPFVRDALVHHMTADWNTMSAVTNGTDYLRELHGRYLPQEPREDEDAYYARISRSVLSPYTLRLIENAAGMVLRRPITVDGDNYWKDFSANVDGIGSSINEYARRALVSSLTYGHSCILVDFPRAEGILTIADEIRMNRRPYFNNVDAHEIWGWRQESTLPSSRLTQVRLHEWVNVPDGDFGEKREQRIRVLYPGRYEVWDTEGRIESGRYSLPEIPLIPIYSNRMGMLTSKPPLVDIASLNLTHYQRQADLINALHIAANPILVLEGWEDQPDGTSVGVNYGLSTVPGNKIYYVGADSSSFDAQQQEINELEQQMSSLGVTKLLGQKFVAESADAKRIDQAQANSVLSIISMELESALQQAYNVAALYVNRPAPTIKLDRDFDFYRLLGQDVSVLGQLNAAGQITDKTFLEILKSGEILPDTVDLQKELRETKALKKQKEAQARELLDSRSVGGSVGTRPPSQTSTREGNRPTGRSTGTQTEGSRQAQSNQRTSSN